MIHAHQDEEGGSVEWSSQIAAAKQCLLDTNSRLLYNDALERFKITDGHQLDPNFEKSMPDNNVPSYKGSLAALSPRGKCFVSLGFCCLLFVGVAAVAYAVFRDRVNREVVTLRLFDDGVDYHTLAYEVRDTTVHFTLRVQPYYVNDEVNFDDLVDDPNDAYMQLYFGITNV